MAVTLTWVRDHYDSGKDRYIDQDEVKQVIYDYNGKEITKEQMDAALDAWRGHVLLPAYSTPTTEQGVSFNVPTGSILKIGGVEII